MKEEKPKELHLSEQPEEGTMKYFGLMLFYSELDLGISQNPHKWVHVRTLMYPTGFEALEAYANTPCPASQLIRAVSMDDFRLQEEKMRANFKDEQWLETELYPYL